MLDKIKTFLDKWGRVFLDVAMATVTYIALYKEGIFPKLDMWSWLVYFILIGAFIKTDFKSNKYKKSCITFAGIFSFMMIIGEVMYENLYSFENNFTLLMQPINLLYLIGVFNIFYLLLTWSVPYLLDLKINKNINAPNKAKLIFILSFIVILLCQMPYFLNFYPGLLSTDSVSQLNTIINGFSNLSDHHPVMHTLFVAIPYYIGFGLSNSIETGVAFSSFTQMVCLSLTFAYLIKFLYERNVNKLALTAIVLFYAFLPVFGYYSITMWKDVMFGGFLLLLTIETVKLIDKKDEDNLSFEELFKFTLISLLCVFFRNNAIYMYMVLALATFLLPKKFWKKIFACMLFVFVFYFVIKGPIFDALNIKKSASAEYIGMPMQQIGRMAYKGVDFTKEEAKLLNEIMSIEDLKKAYNPKTSDGIKFNENYNAREFNKNKLEYLKLYISLVLKHPEIAVEAYMISTLGYWYPGVIHWTVATGIAKNAQRLTLNPITTPLMDKIIQALGSRSAVILTITWSIALCFWIILIFGYITKKRKGLKYIYAFVPVLGIWLTMLLASPVYGEFRYIFGAYTCLPLFVILPFIGEKKD